MARTQRIATLSQELLDALCRPGKFVIARKNRNFSLTYVTDEAEVLCAIFVYKIGALCMQHLLENLQK